MIINVLDKKDISYLEEILLDDNKNLRVVPYETLKDVPQNDISLFCLTHGYYCIPTQQLIDFIKNEIGDEVNKTIEIGAGNGTISNALGITPTDNFMQDNPDVKMTYKLMMQATVPYGKNVVKMDAYAAVRHYRPDNVVGAWVTHKYDPSEHWRGGNMIGIDEFEILKKVKKYIFIGNEETHKTKPISEIPHDSYNFPWLLSRSLSPDKNVIWIWRK